MQTQNYCEQSLVKAVNNTKIKDIEVFNESNEAVLMLVNLFTLTSLKVESRPSQIEIMFLLKKIKSNFNNYTVEEIELAFDLGVMRDLEPFFAKGESIKHYGTFSIEYFGGVMAAFRKYKAHNLKSVLAKVSSMPIFEEQTDYDFLKSNFIDQFNKFLEGQYPWNYGADVMIFDLLVKHEIIKLDDKEKKEIHYNVIRPLLIGKKYDSKKLFIADWTNKTKIHFFKKYIQEVKEFEMDINAIIKNKIQ